MRRLLSFFLLIITIVAFGQDDDYARDKYYVPSPQTSDFMKYGNLPVSNYTGNLNLQIPIYNYADKDFNLDLSIGYNSSGFVANKQPGILGMNWFLNAGGVITRTIKGVPDDKEGNPESQNQYPFVHGLWYGLKKDANTYTSSDIFNLNEGGQTLHLEWALGSSISTSDDYETTSDIYNFNFMGYSGKFIIGHDKKAHVFGTEGSNTFDINLANYSDQFDDTDAPNSSIIVIKTGDGYKYTFGGSLEKLEYKMQVDIDLDPSTEYNFNPTIVSWHLNEIEAPNGRKVIFEYRSFTVTPLLADQYNYILNRYPKSYSSYFEIYAAYGTWNSSFSGTGYVSSDPNYELLKTVYLNKITIDDCEITFTYSEKDKKFYQTFTTGYLPYDQKNLKLDNITVESFGNTIKEADFTYSYKGNLNKERLFLDALEIQGQEPYTFDYVTGSFPYPTTRGMDYWGYWNGVDNVSADLMPLVSLDIDGNLSYSSNVREPNTSNGVFNLGLLNKITYPTGGYTWVEYEPHRYTQVLDRRSDNNFMPKLYSIAESYAGGARVKKIIDYDGTNQYNEREFIYKKDYDPNIPGSGTSSGILLNWPRFIYAFSSTNEPEHDDTKVVQTNSLGISVNATDNEYITYSNVVEKRADNSYTEFQYSNYSTNPDDTIRSSYNSFLYGSTVIPYKFYIGIYRQPNCKSYERGKLLKKRYYSSGGDLVSEKIYKYDRWGAEDYIASVLLSGNKFFSRKDYTYPYVLKYDTVRNYSLTAQGVYGSDFVQTVTEYDYNSLNLLSLKKTQNSDNHWNIKKYYYPDDYDNNVENFPTLINNNIINKPIDVRMYNNSQLISGTQTKYNNYGQPTNVYSAEIGSGVTDIAFSPGTPYPFTHKVNYEYDAAYNLKEITPDDNNHIYYVWGYNDQYPVAKIESSLDVSITAAVDDGYLSKSDNLADVKNAVSYLQGLLTNYITSDDYMVTLYTYKPLVGMTSETGPDGRTIYYEYDDFGRLQYTRNHIGDGEIINKYEYHYAGQ